MEKTMRRINAEILGKDPMARMSTILYSSMPMGYIVQDKNKHMQCDRHR